MANWTEREADKYSHDKWYENFWYHHKAHVLIGIAVIAVIVTMFMSYNWQDPTDMYILFITESPEVYKEKAMALTNILSEYAGDKNGDGEVNIFIDNVYIGSEFDATNVFKNKEKIMTKLRSGDCMFVIAEDYGAEYLLEGGSCADITGLFPDVAEGSIEYDGTMWNWDNSAFRNSNSDFYLAFGEMSLYFGLRVYEGTIAELTDNSKENYQLAEDLLKAIVTNTKPE